MINSLTPSVFGIDRLGDGGFDTSNDAHATYSFLFSKCTIQFFQSASTSSDYQA